MSSVLLAHSDPERREALAGELRGRGLEAVAVADIESALDAATEATTSLLVEPALLHAEEFEVQTRIDLRVGRPVRILALTHKASAEENASFRRHGAGLLARPLDDLERLVTMLRIQSADAAPWEPKRKERSNEVPIPDSSGGLVETVRAGARAGWESMPRLPDAQRAGWGPGGSSEPPEEDRARDVRAESAPEPEAVPSPAVPPPPAVAPAPVPAAAAPPPRNAPLVRSPWDEEEKEYEGVGFDTQLHGRPAPLSSGELWNDGPMPAAPVTQAIPAAPKERTTTGSILDPMFFADDEGEPTSEMSAAGLAPARIEKAATAPAAPVFAPAPPAPPPPERAPPPPERAPPPPWQGSVEELGDVVDAPEFRPSAAGEPSMAEPTIPSEPTVPSPENVPSWDDAGSVTRVSDEGDGFDAATRISTDGLIPPDDPPSITRVSDGPDALAGGEQPAAEEGTQVMADAGLPPLPEPTDEADGFFDDAMRAQKESPSRETDSTGPTVLVVDDDATFRNFLRDALAGQGYRVHTAINASNALRFLKNTPGIQLVISDLNMPHMDGFELKHEIDRWLGTPMPFIVCTADTSVEKVETAAQVGAAALVPKPIEDLDTFFAIVVDTLRDAGVLVAS